MTRQIVFDTETTGTSVFDDRIVEIACVELQDLVPTGVTFQRYINPLRDIPAEVIAVHGLTASFLKDFPVFGHASIVDEFLEFVGDAKLVAHNSEFDRGFLNAELSRLNREIWQKDRFIDTLEMARKMFPGAPASLNALCKRFSVNTDERVKHGALIDCQLLAAVYLELSGGREQKLALFDDRIVSAEEAARAATRKPRPTPLPSLVSAEEFAAHTAFIAEMGDKAIWKKYETPAEAAE
ncbi:MAG: DNA polymerase III subunit epsilon [Caulobacterales bacterium]